MAHYVIYGGNEYLCTFYNVNMSEQSEKERETESGVQGKKRRWRGPSRAVQLWVDNLEKMEKREIKRGGPGRSASGGKYITHRAGVEKLTGGKRSEWENHKKGREN